MNTLFPFPPLPFTFCSPSSSACLCPDACGMHYPGIFAACPMATGNRRLADGRETLRTSSHSPLLLHFAPGVTLFPLRAQLPRGGSSSMAPALTGLPSGEGEGELSSGVCRHFRGLLFPFRALWTPRVWTSSDSQESQGYQKLKHLNQPSSRKQKERCSRKPLQNHTRLQKKQADACISLSARLSRGIALTTSRVLGHQLQCSTVRAQHHFYGTFP